MARPAADRASCLYRVFALAFLSYLATVVAAAVTAATAQAVFRVAAFAMVGALALFLGGLSLAYVATVAAGHARASLEKGRAVWTGAVLALVWLGVVVLGWVPVTARATPDFPPYPHTYTVHDPPAGAFSECVRILLRRAVLGRPSAIAVRACLATGIACVLSL